jgi:hypothetical protein
MTTPGHLIAAYGQFWDRKEFVIAVEAGGRRQMLGHRKQGHAVRLCDFMPFAGVYILYNQHRATYVGLARGTNGIFERLWNHTADEYKDWSRFSWFAVDPAVESDRRGWDVFEERNLDALAPNVDELVRELEALLIMVLGTDTLAAQRTMRFLAGTEWLQVKDEDYAAGGLVHKVDTTLLSKRLLDAWK